MTQENTNDDLNDETTISENSEQLDEARGNAGLWMVAGIAGTMTLGVGVTVLLNKFSENNEESSILMSQICLGTASLISIGITGVACYYTDVDDFSEAFA